MKKIIAISLVAILAVGSVFAAFSGSANVGVGANFDNGQYGFIDQDTNLNFNIDLATADAEKIEEGDVYASIKGSLKLFLLTGNGGISSFDDAVQIGGKDVAVALTASIDEAKVAGENWYVSILGAPDGNDLAKSAIDTWKATNSDKYGLARAKSTKNATYAVGYTAAPGVEVGVYDYKIGVGFLADADKNPELDLFKQYALSLYALTPEYDFSGVKLQVGASYAVSDAEAKFIGNDDPLNENALGVSAKVGYANDNIATSVATDLGYDIKANKFGADVAANFAYGSIVTVDAYYATTAKVNADSYDNLLSAQVVTDLNGFEVPVKLTVTTKNLVHKQDLNGKVEFTVSDVTIAPSVGYVVADKIFKTGIEASYAHEKFTLTGAFSAETKEFKKEATTLKASASVETDALVKGATLSLAWADAEDLLNNSKDHDKNFGKITAGVSIEF